MWCSKLFGSAYGSCISIYWPQEKPCFSFSFSFFGFSKLLLGLYFLLCYFRIDGSILKCYSNSPYVFCLFLVNYFAVLYNECFCYPAPSFSFFLFSF